MKNADFAAKSEEWCVRNPEECYGEMNYTNNEADIRTAWSRYRKIYNSSSEAFFNVICVLSGIAMLVVNTILYFFSLISFDVLYSGSAFGIMTVAGLVILLMPLGDALREKRKADRMTEGVLSSGIAGVTCGCRFYNNRIEFISCREHVIYTINEIEYIYECVDGLYIMLFGNGLRYIPARFFDREFACLITERLGVTFSDVYRRRQYMTVSVEAEPCGGFSSPDIERCEPDAEFSYIVDRRTARRLTGCGRMRPIEIIHTILAVLLGLFVAYLIFFSGMDTALNRGILILDIIYLVICLLMHLSGIPIECDRYAGRFLTRFFDEHMSVVSRSSVIKIYYRSIRSVKHGNECCIFTLNGADGVRNLVIPDYAVPDVEGFIKFMQSKGILI